jgi:formate-dependent nitrite reductase membrane component NrfD
MLRIFKPQSPMSVGAWILSAFGACAVPGSIALELHERQILSGSADQVLRFAADLLVAGSAFWGLGLATYTGVLLGATVIPAWFLHRTLLPIHFGTAGLGSAAGLLELLGYRSAALNALGILAASVDCALWIWLEIDKHGKADRALRQSQSGWLIRTSEILSGPLALVLRLTNFVPLAAISFLVGALISRFGWISAGKVSGNDPEAVFASQS